MAALDDSPRPGKAPEITDDARAWLVSLACQKAKELGVRSVVIDGPQSWSKASVDGCVWWWGVGEARGCLGVCVHRGRWLVSWACH